MHYEISKHSKIHVLLLNAENFSVRNELTLKYIKHIHYYTN